MSGGRAKVGHGLPKVVAPTVATWVACITSPPPSPWAPSSPPAGSRDPTAAKAPTVTMTGITAAQATIFEWALALFAAADLPLPDIDIVGHDSTSQCMGRAGMHTFAAGRSTIDVCTRGAGPVQEFLFLHELAHAWDRAGLTAERRQAFLAQRGLTAWRNDDPERWHDRGAEHAAEIIMWGLMDRPIRVVRLGTTGAQRSPLGYVALVGRPPLHGYTNLCQNET